MAVAEAAVEQAQHDLERTTITAPFPAHVLDRMADLGSEISASDEVAQLVCVAEYWIVASVPDLQAALDPSSPSGDEQGSQVFVHHEAAWGEGRRREGRVKSLIGTLDRTTRLGRVLVTVKDPLAREPDPEHPDRPALIVGSIVEVRIQATPLEDVVRIDRAHLRKDDTVWVMKDGKLEIRPVDVAFEDPDHAYLRGGLEAGELVVKTNLATVAADAPLRTEATRRPIRTPERTSRERPPGRTSRDLPATTPPTSTAPSRGWRGTPSPPTSSCCSCWAAGSGWPSTSRRRSSRTSSSTSSRSR